MSDSNDKASTARAERTGRRASALQPATPREAADVHGVAPARRADDAASRGGWRGALAGIAARGGNQAALRALRAGRASPAPRPFSEPAEEQQANRIADVLEPNGNPRLLRNAAAEPPRAFASEQRGTIERLTGQSLDGARIRRDAAGDREAASLGALAFTRGNEVTLAPSAPPLQTSTGRWLLAHELTHVAQQRQGAERVRRYDGPGSRFHDPGSDMVSDVPGAIPGDAMDPTSGLDVDQIVEIAAPVLHGQKRRPEDAEQRYHLHSGKLSTTPISAYAVPRARLTWDAAGRRPVHAPDAGAPEITPGTEVYGPAHEPLAVLGADPVNVVVESSKAVHFAVGAGSCVLVQTTNGWYLFDAGINLTESNALADAVVAKIAAKVGNDSIRAVFLTHAHYDHTSLLSRLARVLQIDTIVANPRQFTREEYQTVREAVQREDLARRRDARDRLAADAEQRRSFVESLERSNPSETVEPTHLEDLWRREVARRIHQQFPELRELSALPIRGSAGGEFDTIGTHPLHGGDIEGGSSLADILPSREPGTDFRGIVDPALRARQDRSLAEHEVDRMSTTYVLTVDGRRLVMMPDLRRTDVLRIAQELKDALGTQNVEFQEWQLGHHMQAGFAEGMVSARTMSKTLDVLASLRAAGRDGRVGRDAVVASVDFAQVDLAQIRLLRLLGFETYLAHSQADVHTYEVLSEGKLIRGVRGPLAPGASGEPTLQRAELGRRDLQARRARLVTERRGMSGPGSGARKAELLREIRALEVRIERLRALETAVINAARARTFDASVAASAEAALNLALDAEHVGRIATSSSQLTDTALVLIREPLGPDPAPDTPEAHTRAEAKALREQKARVDMLRDQLPHVAPEERQGAQAELYAELAEYEHQLGQASEVQEPSITRDFAGAELGRIRGDRVALETAFGTRTEARLPDGQLAQNQVIRLPPREAGEWRGPSRTAQGMMKVLGGAGRVMGGVMVISTITGSNDLIERYQSGQANAAQFAFGGAREITSGVVGLRMLRGVPVSASAFAVISVLEVTEAALGDYDSETERSRAVGHAVQSGAVNLGCMAVGEALMMTANPIGIAAGAIVMFLGPIIIGKLLDDPPEPLFPKEVGAVDERLAKLIKEYEAVIGGRQAVQRNPQERATIGLTTDISEPARASVLQHRTRALLLEAEIMDEFEAAYGRTREGRAGLAELDEMRRRFLNTRTEASTDATDDEARQQLNDSLREVFGPVLPEERDASGRMIPLRELTLRRFRAIEKDLSLDRLTASQVHDMEQWQSIKDNASELSIQVLRHPKDPDWKDIASRQHDLEARLASARYRLEPEAQAPRPELAARHAPLLAPDTDTRRAYERELAVAESFVRGTEMLIARAHWMSFQFQHVDTPHIEAFWSNSHFSSPLERDIAVVDDTLDVYERTVSEIGGPPEAVGGVEALYREPSARAIYLSEIEHNRPFRKLLRRLEVNEVAAGSLFRSLDARVAASQPAGAAGDSGLQGRVQALHARFERLQNHRREGLGILFSYEVQDVATRERQRAISYYLPLLGGSAEERSLTREEAVAFSTGDYGETGQDLVSGRRAIGDRLRQIPELRLPFGPTEATDSSGETLHISRAIGGIVRLDALLSAERLLVGVVERNGLGLVKVVPLNQAAVTFLGGYAPQFVFESRLTSATEDDLAP